MGDNGHLKYGDPAAWEQYGKSNSWALEYDLGGKETTMADDTIVNMPGTRKASLEVVLAQSHPEEFALLDALRESATPVEFWGDGGTVDGDVCEVYCPEVIITGVTRLETPSSDNMKIALSLKINPQAAVFEFQGLDLPTATEHGDDVITSNNEFFSYFVAIP